MHISTTPYINGHEIQSNKGCVFSQVVRGFAIGQGFFDGFRAIAGERSSGHEELIEQIRAEALKEIKEEAARVGANAIVGLQVEIDPVSLRDRPMILAKASGTAVVI
ncbi:MAG: YbjQ family protein [Defluviitaleaceae bacterium]|nr:YbjQ family protein [Defluviitaleaceae bacterium]